MLWCSLVVSTKVYAVVLIGCVYESLCCGAHWLYPQKIMLWGSLVVSMKFMLWWSLDVSMKLMLWWSLDVSMKLMLWWSLVVSMKAYAVVLIGCVNESLCCGAHWLCI